MTENVLARFDRATAVADSVLAGVKPEQLGDPTPCTEWTLRQLINHVVTGNMMFLSTITGGPRPDRDRDHVGDEPLDAFRRTAAELRTAVTGEGVLERTYPTPLGTGPGSLLATMRAIDTTVHSWDVAKATGQSTDLDPELAQWALATLRAVLPADRQGSPFGDEQPAPADATAADRLAAFAGRVVA